MATVAFIGLGTMGFPMAGHLAAAGHDVQVYNRTAATAQQWASAHKGAVFSSPGAAAQGAHIVCLCVGNDADVRAVALGEDGVLATMVAGSLLVDHTTASREVALELAAVAADKQIGFVDAPVSGGQAGAENGALTVMCGGSQADFDQAQPVFECYAKTVALLGPVGAGQLAKMANQMCIAGVLQGLSEAVNFAQLAGLDLEELIPTLAGGAAQSWQMENRAQTMGQDKFDFGFAVDWMRKDLGIALAQSNQLGARVPLTALVDQFYADVQAQGGGRWDTSSLIKRLR